MWRLPIDKENHEDEEISCAVINRIGLLSPILRSVMSGSRRRRKRPRLSCRPLGGQPDEKVYLQII